MPPKRKPRNRFERCGPVLAWLIHEYPCGRPVRLAWKKEILHTDEETGKVIHCWGVADRVGKSMVIQMSKRKCRTWTETIEILIHEYVHCMQWGLASVERHPKIEEHPDAFGAQYMSITRRYQSGGGAEESSGYEFE